MKVIKSRYGSNMSSIYTYIRVFIQLENSIRPKKKKNGKQQDKTRAQATASTKNIWIVN